MKRAALRHEALHDRMQQLEFQLSQRQRGRERINLTQNLEDKKALIDDEISHLNANLNYISHLGPLSIESVSPAPKGQGLDHAADIKLF